MVLRLLNLSPQTQEVDRRLIEDDDQVTVVFWVDCGGGDDDNRGAAGGSAVGVAASSAASTAAPVDSGGNHVCSSFLGFYTVKDPSTAKKMMVLSTINQQRRSDKSADTKPSNPYKKMTFPSIFRWSFGLKALAVMVLFTVSLVVLPLVLPPLPPPPSLFLLIPVLIMSVLVYLAFVPTELPPDAGVYSG
ncbi:hypothetical protein E3N88_34125 [Mikania micrantha]|uniref:Uncharacterized protein n=1 Tax=Mikania micrantha TaxID=192012 RepID=A0A5N6MDC6_9ASTR|nr:hypothetical protein E3N88_34125 [Mikania micrantha]